MPGLEINSHGIPAVEAIGEYLQELLDHAEGVKPARTLEPALTKADFDDIYGHVARIFTGFDDPSGRKLRQYAIVETAARDIFGKLIVSALTIYLIFSPFVIALLIVFAPPSPGQHIYRLARLCPRLEPL